MNGAARWLPLAGVALAAALFTAWNRGERVVVDLGLATFYRAPLTVVVAAAFVAGMLAMLLLGLRHDLRVRRELQGLGLIPVPAPASRGPAPAPAPAAEDDRTLLAPPFDPYAGPVPEAESAAIRVVPPSPDRTSTAPHAEDAEVN